MLSYAPLAGTQRVKPMNLFASTAISLGILAATLNAKGAMAADGDACRFEKPKLVCAESTKDGKAVLDAMADPQSMELMQKALVDSETRKQAYADGYEREDYRKSLEANRKSATRYANRAFRSYRRKKLSADDYEAIRVKYEKAVATYSIGMNVYRAGTWLSNIPRD